MINNNDNIIEIIELILGKSCNKRKLSNSFTEMVTLKGSLVQVVGLASFLGSLKVQLHALSISEQRLSSVPRVGRCNHSLTRQKNRFLAILMHSAGGAAQLLVKGDRRVQVRRVEVHSKEA